MLMPGGGLGSHSNWLQGLDSPLIQEDAANAGQKELKLRFDVSQYTPEEIMVKTVDNKLLVGLIVGALKTVVIKLTIANMKH